MILLSTITYRFACYKVMKLFAQQRKLNANYAHQCNKTEAEKLIIRKVNGNTKTKQRMLLLSSCSMTFCFYCFAKEYVC